MSEERMTTQEKTDYLYKLWERIEDRWTYIVDTNNLEDLVNNLCLFAFRAQKLRDTHPMKFTLWDEDFLRGVAADLECWGFIMPDQEEEDEDTNG